MTEQATIAGGCYWCFDALFRLIHGVSKVETGYSGGHVDSPSMRRVYQGDTGHAEAVQISYDPEIISYHDILEIFFTMHDPTTLNRQGNDVGDEYRSAIFYHNSDQQRIAESMKTGFASKLWSDAESPVVTEVVPLDTFWPADADNQDFFNKNPDGGYCQIIINPKVQKLRQKFAERYFEKQTINREPV